MRMRLLSAGWCLLAVFAVACGSNSKSTTATSNPAASLAAQVELRGLVQLEKPCLNAKFKNGCLRLLTDQGAIYYIDQTNQSPEAEFNVVPTNYDGITLYRLWFNGTDSVLLSHNQPLLMKVEKTNSTISMIYSVSTTGHLDN